MSLTQQPVGRSVRRYRVLAGTLAAGLALSVLGACAGSGASDSSAGSDTAARAAGAEPGPGAAPGQPDAGDAAKARDGSGSESAVQTDQSSSAGIAAAALQQRRQIRAGQVSVQVRDVEAAVSSARSFATAAQGFVSEEKTSTRPVEAPDEAPGGGTTSPANVPSVVVDQSVLTLRVPQQVLDDVMGQVGGLGVVRSRSQSSQDVTDSYVDTASRVKSQRASVDRVRTLLGRATGIGDVVRLESELSRREADLDALEARLAALDDSTTLATLVVTFSRPDAETPAPRVQDGFLGGLLDGWHALVSSTAVVLQIVGALVPFAVVLTLLGLPVWLVLRRRRGGSPAPSDSPAPTA